MNPPVSPATVLQIKALAHRRMQTKEIARHLRLSVSTIHKIRQGYYDHRLTPAPGDAEETPALIAVWCRRCRCHVYPPCQACRVRDFLRRRPKSRPRSRISEAQEGLHHSPVAAKLRLSVAEIGLSLRTVNYLQQRGIQTVNELLHCTPAELLRIPNFGAKTLEQVYRCLARLGFIRRSASAQQPALRKAA